MPFQCGERFRSLSERWRWKKKITAIIQRVMKGSRSILSLGQRRLRMYTWGPRRKVVFFLHGGSRGRDLKSKGKSSDFLGHRRRKNTLALSGPFTFREPEFIMTQPNLWTWLTSKYKISPKLVFLTKQVNRENQLKGKKFCRLTKLKD